VVDDSLKKLQDAIEWAETNYPSLPADADYRAASSYAHHNLNQMLDRGKSISTSKRLRKCR
jgi:hypothetical protein